MIKDRGDEVIEMPPLDYVFPAEMGGAPNTQPQEQIIQQDEVQDDGMQGMLSLYDLPAPELQDQDPQVEVNGNIDEDYVEPIEQVAQPAVQQKKQAKTQQESFRELRLAKERSDQKAEELAAKIMKIQEDQLRFQQMQQQPKQTVPEVKEWYDELPPEDLTENKHIQRMAQDMRAMKAQLKAQEEKALEQERIARDMAAMNRAKSQYPDMDKVVNPETINDLIKLYPTEALEIEQISNKYTQSVLAYTTIKNLGLYKETENIVAAKKPAYESDILKAKVNAAKPRPMASINPQQGESPLSQANAFANGYATEAMQAKLRAEMKHAASMY